MNTQKLAQAFLQLSQAFATVHEALLEQPLRVHSEPAAEPSTPVQSSPPAVSRTVAADTAPAPAPAPAPAAVDQFSAFADQLKGILQTVAPGALNIQLGQMIERYAPGAGAPGQGGIRKIPAEQYADFLAEVRQAAAALGGAVQ